MTKRERDRFIKLTKDRSDDADTMGKRNLRGLWDGIVEKYSDQAHFIYELLQNADDAGADSARFILEPKRLIFAHNGKRLFSVSNPDTEDNDTKKGRLGDVNSITSIGNSNKAKASIGKFGVGFKAVFQYTASPRIYGPNLRFRIDRYIVPTLLDSDFKERKRNETLFVFPFDRKGMSPEDAHADISAKLQALTYPLLFLSHLQSISYRFGRKTGVYEKKCDKECVFDQTIAQHMTLTQKCGSALQEKTLWLFTRKDDSEYAYSCGFFTDNKGKLHAVREPAFCFFPTKEVTGLSFIIHAPFLLTDSRESIRSGVPHNNKMIELLAKLSADSLLYLRDEDIGEGKRLIDDDIISIIPYDEEIFSDVSDKQKVSFRPFYEEIKIMFSIHKLIPSKDSYTDRFNAYWADIPQLASLFTDVQLAEITGNPNAVWVFPSLGRDGVQRNNPVLSKYLDSITRTSLNEDHILNGKLIYGRHGYEKGIPGIAPDFVERQTIEWLHRFYEWLSSSSRRAEKVKRKSVFLNQEKKAVAAFDSNGHPILFLPSRDVKNCETVYTSLLRRKTTAKFFEMIGIRKPSVKDYIYNTILPMYTSKNKVTIYETDIASHTASFFQYYRQCPQEEQVRFIELIKRYSFLFVQLQDDTTIKRGTADKSYFPDDTLKTYFSAKKDTCFIALDKYKALADKKSEKAFKSFLTELGVKRAPRVYLSDISKEEIIKRKLPKPTASKRIKYYECRIDGCNEIIASITAHSSITESVALWEVLLRVIDAECQSV